MSAEINIHQFTGLTSDSRKVVNGGLFAALKGQNADGRDFTDQALQRGAAAILTDMRPCPPSWPQKLKIFQDPEPRARLARLAAEFYGARPPIAALVTGTSGKTSTVEFARQILTATGRPAASIGTLGILTPNSADPGGLTSPDSVDLMATLAELSRSGISAVAIEASSHGLDQSRLTGVQAEIGVFTSFSRDHLDYHKDEESYLSAKLRIFSEAMAPGGVAIIASSTSEFPKISLSANRHTILTYGRDGRFLRIRDAIPDRLGLILEIAGPDGDHRVKLDHFAFFQAENALAAAAIAIASGGDPSDSIQAIESLNQPRGRMQRAGTTPEGAQVYIDYAHKPGALEACLNAIKLVTAGRVTVVFGCGGDRDRGKRGQMGEIAARLADRVIVTDDNPRNEDPVAIRRAVLEGARGGEEIGDRRAAIKAAIEGLRKNDALLIAGKGHEQGQIFGTTSIPFDDLEEAKIALSAITGNGEAT